ncbi:MAG TPA: ATP-binding protein [Thermoanaerobaculia bacterium]
MHPIILREPLSTETAEGRFAFLAEVSHVLASSLDYQETIASLTRLVVPSLADYCIVDVFDDRGEIQRVQAVHKDPARQLLMDEVRRHPPNLGAPAGPGWVLRTGQAVFSPEVTEEELRYGEVDQELVRLRLELAPKSMLLVPLMSRNRILGCVMLALADRDRRYTPADFALAEELGYRAALAIDNARLFAELAAADRAKDEFLAMLAHELRNPLAAISNAASVLRGLPAENRRAHEMAEKVGRQVRHLSRLVDDLLDVSRFTRGLVELRKEPVALQHAAEGALEATRPLIEQRRHELTVDMPEEPLWLEADRTRIEQIVANLLNNAAKFTDPGGKIRLSVERQGDQAVLRVRDNGAGIHPELLPRIFDLFVQEDRSLARSHGGLGIGLTLVRGLVERHGGTVAVSSDGPGRGSEITVRLPLTAPPQAAPRPAAASPAPDAAPEGPSRILVVEDNVDAADALAELLRLWGHDVEVAHDGAAALEQARLHQPGVVLLDIGLPGMDGYQVTEALQRMPDLPRPLIIALTGYGQESDRQRSRRAGFDHHLVKPVDLEQLRSLLERAKLLQAN